MTITSSRKRNETFNITKGMKVLLSSVAYANAINRSRMQQTQVKTWKEISNMVEQCVVCCTCHHRYDCFWYPFYAARTNLAQLLCCRERGWIVQHHTIGWMVNVATHTYIPPSWHTSRLIVLLRSRVWRSTIPIEMGTVSNRATWSTALRALFDNTHFTQTNKTKQSITKLNCTVYTREMYTINWSI